MRLKKLGAAMFVAVALAAVLAGSASATAITTEKNWYTGEHGETKLLGGTFAAAELVPKTTVRFTTEVIGQPVEITSTAVECESCTVSNSPAAGGSGYLKFSSITVMKPAGCTLSSVKTKKLVVSADYMEGLSETALVKFTPEGGESSFATFELGGGEACPLSLTPISAKGTVFGQAANKTGIFATHQDVLFTPTINSLAGGSLVVGAKAATLEGNIRYSFGAIVIGESAYFGVK